MAAKTRLTRIQRSALQKVADNFIYDHPDRLLKGVYCRDQGVNRTDHWLVPSRATLLSLWRRDLIEYTPEPTVTDSGENLGYFLRLTSMGRHELRESQPKTFTTSWRVNITPGAHPRVRTDRLKPGDLILMGLTDGRREWRRVVTVEPWITGVPDWREMTTEDTDGGKSKTYAHAGKRRWTTQPAPESTDGA